MKKKIHSLYKKYIPKMLQKKISLIRNKGGYSTLRKSILDYYKLIPDSEINRETKEVLKYLNFNPIATFPYHFVEKYHKLQINVFEDPVSKLKYVHHHNNCLYFKRSLSVESIKKMYRELLIEQDIDSPHCYLNKDFIVNNGDVVVDCGAAEGIFALSIIDISKKVYIIESDPEWIEALNLTFFKWKDKVCIENKFISNTDTLTSITLDTYFSEEKISFLKIDVDGSEYDLVQGAKKIFNKSDILKIALCTYHKLDDYTYFYKLFRELKYECFPSYGYMFFLNDSKQYPPYLRRGIMRIKKSILS
jgi:hypothetical protein